ncbi:BTAD domain-containing putative transcriptional regulator [Streptomyces sp. 5.8]|uniref:BTAD domain-containing putative transcriptional regulator n=1 Tax=Streptomyces sp. 5.8 TaxID=3406571 RepID=UPI003BB70B38
MVDLGAPKQRTLLALLVSQAGRPVSTDVILEALWEGNPPPSAMTSLQAYVAKLRKVLEPGRAPRTQATVLCTYARGYVLDAGAVDVDVHRFGAHAEAGRQARDREDPRAALREFDAGLALWRGQPFAEVSGVPCVVPEVARLEEVRLSVVEMRCEALLALGAHEVAVAELRAFVESNPLREYGCELLSLALYRAGRQADALEVLRTIQARLSEELGVDPTLRLQQIRQQILNQDPALDWQPAPAVPDLAALPDLPDLPAVPALPAQRAAAGAGGSRAPHGPVTSPPADDTAEDVFVGREAAVRQLTEALAAAEAGRGQVVTVSGEPGAGKTSLLRRFAERSGVPVLWGTCAEHIAAPLLSQWEQVLRAADTAFPGRTAPRALAERLNRAAQPAAGMDAAGGDPGLFDAIGRHLTGLSTTGALVVMLDHVHRACPASQRMLVRLAESVPDSRLLLIASYRSDQAPALAGTLAALSGANPTRIQLGGLTPRDTQALAGALVGSEVSSRTAEGLCARSGGNPVLLHEMLKLLAGEQRSDRSDTTPVPAPVREVVLHRVARLPQPAAELLAVAAVAGRHFDVEVVADVASIEIDTALAVLDSAIAAGLIDEDKQRLGWFCFTDALVADALYEITGRMRRGRLHLRIEAAAGRAWAAGRATGPLAPATADPRA